MNQKGTLVSKKYIVGLILGLCLLVLFFPTPVKAQNSLLIEECEPMLELWGDDGQAPSQPYIAAYMTTDLIGDDERGDNANALGVTVSFDGTDKSVIQSDNWLMAGITGQGPDRVYNGCEAIDWGYSFSLVVDGIHSDPFLHATVWECHEYGDDCIPPWYAINVSSWNGFIPGLTISSSVTLTMEWSEDTLDYYAEVGGTNHHLVAYYPNETASHYFMTGTWPRRWPWTGTVKWLQFHGAWSEYNIDQVGWQSRLMTPRYIKTGDSSWTDVSFAYSTDGPHAFLDHTIMWGGDDYENVDANYCYKYVHFYPTSDTTIDPDTLLWNPSSEAFTYTIYWDSNRHGIIDVELPDRTMHLRYSLPIGTYHDVCTPVKISATPDSHYYLDYWILDGVIKYTDTLYLVVYEDHSVYAYFTFYNNAPNTPSTPSGPTTVYRNVWYTYSTCATDPDGDSIRYHLNVTGPGNPYQNTTIWVDSGTAMSWNLLWEPTDSPGTYLIQTWVEDVHGALSPMSSLSVTMINRAPNTPFPPVRIGSTTVYRNVSYTYYTSTTDPDGDDVRYQFEFTGPGLDVSPMTGWYASGQTGSITVMWENEDPLGTYQIRVRAQDVYEEWSYWSPYLTVNLVNSPPNTPSLTGTTAGYVDGAYTYKACATDPDDDSVNYTFYWADGTTTTTGYYDSGVEVSRSHSWSSTGTYSVQVKATDVYGAYNFSSSLTVTIQYGGGGCPTLFVWNGSDYVDYGVINIHDVENDVIREVPVQAEDVGVAGYKVKFKLREGWEGLNYSHSLIDQVKLYAVDNEGNHYLCPLIKAEHSEQGKVWLKLLFSDDYRTDTYLMDTIDLTFIMPYPTETIENFTFIIEGHNSLKL